MSEKIHGAEKICFVLKLQAFSETPEVENLNFFVAAPHERTKKDQGYGSPVCGAHFRANFENSSSSYVC